MIFWNKNKPSVLLFIVQSLAPYAALILGQAVTAVICAVDISVRPYLIKQILNKLAYTSTPQGYNELGLFALFYIGAAMVLFCNYRVRDMIWLHLAPNLKKTVALKMMDTLMIQSHHFFQHHFAGSLANKIGDAISGIVRIMKIVIDEFFGHLLAVCIAIYTVWHVSPFFSVALAIWVVVFVSISITFSKRAADYADFAAEQKSRIIGNIVDILSNMMSVRLFGTKHLEYRHLSTTIDTSIAADQRRNWFYFKINTAQGLSFIIFQSLCFWWLIRCFAQGTVTAGDFALILSINVAIVNCLWNISKDVKEFSESLGDVTQGIRVVLIPLELHDTPTAQELQIQGGEIMFDRVSFCYKDAGQFFENKTIHIPAGQKVGLVGYSGSGKTTFIHLILRLFDVTSGRILIDNQDITNVTQQSLHNAIGIIPQEPSLFHRTIMENIRYGRPDATDHEVVEAAKKAHAHDFIIAQPQGYQTMVGERGTKLSGGQRQRIIIARAFLKNSPIIILDEATSQLDSVTEMVIQEGLEQLMQNKTTLVIAHRLSTLLTMDRIIVFDQGIIVQDGTHDELLQQPGLYQTLWYTQTNGMLNEPVSTQKGL